MFKNTQNIIYIQQHKLTVAVIKLGKNPRILKSDQTGWNSNSLEKTFKQAQDQFESKKIRILLGDELSHVLRITIPKDKNAKKNREFIAEKIAPQIPESLDSKDWDFKDTGKTTDKNKEVLIFAPVKKQFNTISQAIAKSGLQVEAIEPESVSKLRHYNPLIGIALKKDIKGKDKKVLNLKPKFKFKTKSIKNQLNNNKSSIINKSLLIALIISIIIGSIVIGGVLTQKKALENNPSSNTNLSNIPVPSSLPFPKSSLSPESTSSAIPLATPSASKQATSSATASADLTQYVLRILNGTGEIGLASKIQAIFEAKEFKNIQTDNADSYDFDITEIKLKENLPDKLFTEIENILKDDYEVTKSAEFLNDELDYDVEITIGKSIN